MAWIDNGPISLPTMSVARIAGVAILLAALAGAALGLRGAWRDETPSLGAAEMQGTDQTTPARPIVEIQSAQQQVAASNAAASNSAQATEEADANAIAAKTAAAEEAQAKPSKPPVDIDEILTSQSEKPQAPAKPASDEGAPGADKGSNEVPF